MVLQLVRIKPDRLVELVGPVPPAVKRRHALRVMGGLPGSRGRAVETARTETLGVRVVRHDVPGDMPGDVAAESVAALALVETDRESAQAGRGACAVQVIDNSALDPLPAAGALAVVLRAVLVLVVLVETRATGDGEDFRNDIEVD